MHPYDAERQIRGFLINDREQMLSLASLYDPDVPAHENVEFVAETRKYMARYEQAMRGTSEAFGSRLDRGWVPPSIDDLETEQEAAAKK